MDTQTSTIPVESPEITVTRRTWTGMLLIAITLVLQALSAGYTVPYTLQHSSIDSILQGSTNPVMTALSCLTIIAGIVQLIGYIILVSSAQRLSRSLKRLCWIAFILVVASLILILIVNIPLGYAVSLGGSRVMGIVALWVTALSQVVGFSALALLLMAFATDLLKWIGIGVAGLQSLVSLVSAGFATASYRLVELNIMGTTMYLPNSEQDPVKSALAITGLILSGVFALIFLISTIQLRSRVADESSDRVV